MASSGSSGADVGNLSSCFLNVSFGHFVKSRRYLGRVLKSLGPSSDRQPLQMFLCSIYIFKVAFTTQSLVCMTKYATLSFSEVEIWYIAFNDVPGV